jgi:hypothetical protein
VQDDPSGPRTTPKTSIGWLHLADLHQTLRRPGWPLSTARAQLFEDLSRLHERCGPWELVIVAGDLSMRGDAEELDEAQRTLEALRAHLATLGSSPCLLAVPGNHDLVRTQASPSALRKLRRWHEDESVRKEFWNDADSPARRLVDRAFEPFEQWWAALNVAEHGDVSVRRGLLPGDFTATIRKDGLCFGVAGLNSAFLQVTGEDYEGQLALEPQQLNVASGGDTPAWIAQHHACVLVTHHGPSWLEPAARSRYESAINPAGRFLAHLSAHVHGATPLVETGERLQIKCASFLGLDAWEDSLGRSGARLFGYTAARLVVDGDEARLDIFPRLLSNARLGPADALIDVDLAVDVARTFPVQLFAPLDQPALGLLIERAGLRDALAAVYRSAEDARRLAGEAGVRINSSARGGAAVDVWHVVITEADRRDRLRDLVKIARLEYPANARIAEAWATFERASSGSSTSPQRASIGQQRLFVDEEQIAEALQERLTNLQPAVFEAVLSLASLDDQVPGPGAPQASRSIAAVRQMEKKGQVGLNRLDAAVGHIFGSITAHGVGSASMAGRVSSPRKPTVPSLQKFLDAVFADPRDFDGFCLDEFPAIYRRFTNGMDGAHRARFLVANADPIEILAGLRRRHASAFAKHQRLIDYEEGDEETTHRPSWD